MERSYLVAFLFHAQYIYTHFKASIYAAIRAINLYFFKHHVNSDAIEIGIIGRMSNRPRLYDRKSMYSSSEKPLPVNFLCVSCLAFLPLSQIIRVLSAFKPSGIVMIFLFI